VEIASYPSRKIRLRPSPIVLVVTDGVIEPTFAGVLNDGKGTIASP
jgi:hypothetical protein